MAKHKASDVAAKLAIEGAVAALAGTVKGTLGLTPRQLSEREKIDLAMTNEGVTLYYELDGGDGVFLHNDNAFTTIWYGGPDASNGIAALDALIQRLQPQAKQAKDGPHATEQGFNQRTYDIKLANDMLAIVDAIYPVARVQNPKFMVRVTAMAKQH